MNLLNRPSRLQRRPTIRVGNREFETHGAPRQFGADLYYKAMTVSWPLFFVAAALIFAVINSGFAVLYFLGDAPVANIRPDSFIDLFYFSIETLATVGYGDMHPQTGYGHLIATVEIFTGMSFLAVMTGLVFARFSRPRARFVFADYPVVARHEGRPTLMIRIANARHNFISGATARLWLIRAEETAEGLHLRRYYELNLHRRENPVFVLSWTIFHTIDEQSPLYGLTAEDLARSDTALALTVSGLDDSSEQQLHARRAYAHDRIRWQHRYADIASVNADGRWVIDYERFHAVVPEEQ